MRSGLLLVVLSSAWAPYAMAADDEFPYTAYVNSDDVYVRSGPGQDYYPTDKLSLGEPVEVYRHDPGGWLAVRPPRRSFSWVSARYLRLTDDDLAVVEGERVVARVGTVFSDVRDVIQVRLDRGEEVEVIDAARLGSGAEGQTWYKVAPPAGEFRWVYSKYVDRESIHEQQPDDADVADSDAGAVPEGDDEVDEPGFGTEDTSDPSPGSGSVELASDEQDLDDRSPAGRQLGSRLDEASRSARPPRSWRGERAGAGQAKAKVEPETSLQAELDDIDLELTVMVAEEPSVWSFGDLRARTESCLDRAATALERGKVRLVLNKITRFEDIKARYDDVAATRRDTNRKNEQLNAAAEATDAESTVLAESEEKFDGSGRLTPVVSRRVGAPTFALVDEQGVVQTFLTPTPGFNLQSYIGQQIGVTGQRGFIPELKKPHVVASRVTVLR